MTKLNKCRKCGGEAIVYNGEYCPKREKIISFVVKCEMNQAGWCGNRIAMFAELDVVKAEWNKQQELKQQPKETK